jgi:aspartyl-tRNA(Asn)/glutamyl-tRNA(Gln) amidotransferase subunit C
MSIDRKTVDNTAQLARLALADDERERLREQLSAILGHIAVLEEADTSQVPASANVLSVHTVMAADRSRPSTTPDVLLDNAPAREENYLRVRAVLEEE